MTNKDVIECIRNILSSDYNYDETIGYQLTSDDFEWLEKAKEAVEKQIPKRPYLDNDNGIYEKEYCPTCHRSLFPNDHHCICGQTIDWSKNNDL